MAEQAETRAEAEDEGPESSSFWLKELTAAGKREDTWRQRGRSVIARFRDERDRDTGNRERRFNILWANTILLKAALFQRLGNPDVRRRFPKKGQDERVTKTAALVLERGAAYVNDVYECSRVIKDVVEDMLLPGRGVAWVVYDAEVGTNPETGQEEIVSQTLKDEHVYWEDYRTSAGRTEADIWWKARAHCYSRDELVKFFGEKHGEKVPLNVMQADASNENAHKDDDTFKRARVWEIWDKTKKQRVYVAEDYEWILKKDPDPYRLTGFFPCPPSLYGVKTTNSLTPIPEFTLYQDKADELDDISTRLSVMIQALKRRGVYDAGAEGTDNTLAALALAGDNQFYPWRNMGSLLDKGGLSAAFQTEDLKPVVTVIEGLYKRGQVLIQEIYELTGISDVLRGSSNASETATAQQIKANFGSMRLQARQDEVQQFIRGLLHIKAEILAEHFTREQLQEMTGIDMPLEAEKAEIQQKMQALQMQAQMMGGQPPPIPPEQMKQMQETLKAPTWEEISAILRSDQRRSYKIDVETDQTSQVDEQAEKASRIEFMSTIQAMMEKVLPLAMQMPAMRPLVKEAIMFVVKAYKAGRPLEEAFDEAFTALEQMPPPQQQGDPIAEAKAQQIQAQTQATIQTANLNAQNAQLDASVKQREAEANMASKVIDIKAKQAEIAQKQELSRMEAQMQMRQQAHAFGREVEKADMDRAMDAANRELADVMNVIQAQQAMEDLENTRAKRMLN
jgi:hypothetical protein